MHGAMRGLRVVEVAQWWFVPAAGAVLADWGADVIKVEHPVTGDPLRGLVTSSGSSPATGGVNFMVEQANRGKRSVGLDLATARRPRAALPPGRERRRVPDQLPAGGAARLRIDVDDMRALNPRIVYVRGHGHGVRGPDIEKGGYDAASFWSRGGIAHALTPPDAASPIMQRAAFGDSTGAMTIAGGIAAALLAARAHRRGAGRRRLAARHGDVDPRAGHRRGEAPRARPCRAATGAASPNPIVNSYRTQGRPLALPQHAAARAATGRTCAATSGART